MMNQNKRTNVKKIRVSLGRRSYSIEIGSGLLDGLADRLKRLDDFSRCLVVTDDNVAFHYIERLEEAFQSLDCPVNQFVIPAGEKSKSVMTAAALWSAFLQVGADRGGIVIALGGGVIGDLAGFIAATYMRGVRFFQIPTTLLAQVDSSVGGKTGIDLPDGKNMVGAFYQPMGVLIDPETLQTLPAREYRAGLGETVKYAVGLDADFFDELEDRTAEINARDPSVLTDIIDRCCRIKAAIVKADEKETIGLRALLNLGHTFAHAYETAGRYDGILHGEAVALGILDALNLAQRLARAGNNDFAEVDAKTVARTKRLFETLSLPTSLTRFIKKRKNQEALWNPARLLEIMGNDKKNDKGDIRFVLPTGLGQSAVFAEIPKKTVRAVLRDRIVLP